MSSKQASTVSKLTTSQSSSTSMNTSSKHSEKMIDNYLIIWLDPTVDFSNEENQESIGQLRSIVNTIKTFSDLNQCVHFLEQINNEKVFLIISDCFAKQIASLEEQFMQLTAIYIFCHSNSKYHEPIKTYKKGQGVFTDMKHLCHELKREIRQLNNDLTSMSIIPVPSTTDNLNELEPLFMYFQLLKENLFTVDYNREIEIQHFVDYCRRLYKHKEKETRDIDEFERTYHDKLAIKWYTKQTFLYDMVNRALRAVEIECLIKMRFFLHDLHEQIKQRHTTLGVTDIPSILYRGFGMFNNQFEKLEKAPGGLISFNSFLSTSCKETVAKDFARPSKPDDAKKSIILKIHMDPLISSIPFALVSDVSAFPEEEEVLFSMATVFRIGKIEKLEKSLWQVSLTITNERDPLMKRLSDHVRISLGEGNVWRKLGQLMIKMGQFDGALETFKVLLKEIDPNDKAENAFLHNQLGYIFKQKDQLKEAFLHYQKSIEIKKTYMSETDPRLSSPYSNIGGILKKLGDTNGALKFYELVLQIDLAAANPNQLEIAIDHNNIGAVLDDQGKYPEALKSYQKALEIKLVYLPPHQPSLASTYSNIGLIHQKMGDYTTSLSFYEKALKIQEKSLPPIHPSFVVTYGKLAAAFEGLHRYKEALEYAQKAVNIARDVFSSSSHPEVEKRERYFNELQRKT